MTVFTLKIFNNLRRKIGQIFDSQNELERLITQLLKKKNFQFFFTLEKKLSHKNAIKEVEGVKK